MATNLNRFDECQLAMGRLPGDQPPATCGRAAAATAGSPPPIHSLLSAFSIPSIESTCPDYLANPDPLIPATRSWLAHFVNGVWELILRPSPNKLIAVWKWRLVSGLVSWPNKMFLTLLPQSPVPTAGQLQRRTTFPPSHRAVSRGYVANRVHRIS